MIDVLFMLDIDIDIDIDVDIDIDIGIDIDIDTDIIDYTYCHERAIVSGNRPDEGLS